MPTDRMLILGEEAGSPAQKADGRKCPGGMWGGAIGIVSLLCDCNDKAGAMFKTLALCGKLSDQRFIRQFTGMIARL